jgi:hypothetical protein
MKNFALILLMFTFFSNFAFAEEKIDISLNKTVIDDVTNTNYDSLFDSSFYKGMYTLFKIDIPDTVKIEKATSRIIVPLEPILDDFKLDRKPKILDFLIEKI